MNAVWHFLLATSVINLAASDVDVNITNHWDTGFEGSICIVVTKELDGWTGHLIFSEDVDTVESWAAKVTKLSGKEFVFESNSFIAQQHVGAHLCFAFEAHVGGNIVPKATFYIEGMDGHGVNSSTSQNTGGGTPSKNYAEALGKSILFYDAQRSGKLPANNPIKWRGDSALDDCVPGGWYDAGDHVKFGLPMASTTTLLLWSLYAFKDGYVKAGQLDMMYDMIKWPLDYFLKAWNPTTKELTAQVGDGNVDHKFWGRPEQMTMARPCLIISESSPGSDVAAETAASLALGAIAFKDKGDTAYSTQLLNAAESLYAFAKANR
ncbi:unnamed protein product [Candidula unifasciata]|uniref:cellulase n=1 Tax=Candidula unifasciata TaxID=100452 RepID=A0A8S3YH15_9EUPU|nr:unnamed protein product [Candidula unifasciata]